MLSISVSKVLPGKGTFYLCSKSQEGIIPPHQDYYSPPNDMGTWSCGVCTLVNQAASVRCDVCGTRRGRSTGLGSAPQPLVTVTQLPRPSVSSQQPPRPQEGRARATSTSALITLPITPQLGVDDALAGGGYCQQVEKFPGGAHVCNVQSCGKAFAAPSKLARHKMTASPISSWSAFWGYSHAMLMPCLPHSRILRH